MRDAATQIEIARSELRRSTGLSDYEAVDVAWVAIVKVANTLPEPNEHKRLVALLDRAGDDAVRKVLSHPSVDALLSLDPPLETILSSDHERLNADRTAAELKEVRELRKSNPKAALRSLIEVLKRNKRFEWDAPPASSACCLRAPQAARWGYPYCRMAFCMG